MWRQFSGILWASKVSAVGDQRGGPPPGPVWTASERCCRWKAAPGPTRPPPQDARRPPAAWRRQARVTVTLHRGLLRSRPGPLVLLVLRAASGGFFCVSCLSGRRLTEPAPRGVLASSLGPLRRCTAAASPRIQRPDALNASSWPPSGCCLSAGFRVVGWYFSQQCGFLGASSCGHDIRSVRQAAGGRPHRWRRATALAEVAFPTVCMQMRKLAILVSEKSQLREIISRVHVRARR